MYSICDLKGALSTATDAANGLDGRNPATHAALKTSIAKLKAIIDSNQIQGDSQIACSDSSGFSIEPGDDGKPLSQTRYKELIEAGGRYTVKAGEYEKYLKEHEAKKDPLYQAKRANGLV